MHTNNSQGFYLGLRMLQLLPNGSKSKKEVQYNFYRLCLRECNTGKERGRGRFFTNDRRWIVNTAVVVILRLCLQLMEVLFWMRPSHGAASPSWNIYIPGCLSHIAMYSNCLMSYTLCNLEKDFHCGTNQKAFFHGKQLLCWDSLRFPVQLL